MFRRLTLLACATLTGCEWITDLVESVDAMTDPLVVLAAVVCVELPEGVDVPDGAAALAPGTSVLAALGDASILAAEEDATAAGLAGGRVTVEGVEAVDHGDGTYQIDPGALEWQDDSTWTLDVDLAGDAGTAWIDLPPAAEWEPPVGHVTGQELVIDLGDQPYDTLLVAVADAATGELAWSNLPDTASELLVAARTTTPLVVTVPGAAFPHDGEWLVGVGAVVHTRPGDLAGVNTLLSAAVAGRMRFHRVPTGAGL